MHVHAHLCIEVPFYKQTRINDWSRYATKKYTNELTTFDLIIMTEM